MISQTDRHFVIMIPRKFWLPSEWFGSSELRVISEDE